MRRRSQAKFIPDSEDDAPFSETSLRGSSPLGRSVSRQTGGSLHTNPRTHRNTKESEGEDPITSITPRMTRRRAAAKIEVVVPGKKSNSPSDTAQSSLSVTPGTNTPATSVSTGVESDAQNPRTASSARKGNQQIAANAKTRVQQTSKRGTKRSASAMLTADTDDDAALAEALQQEEYMASVPKKQKTSNQKPSKSDLQRLHRFDVLDSEDDLSELSTSDEGSRPPSLITDDGDNWESEDEYMENARAEAAAEVNRASNRAPSRPSASHLHSSLLTGAEPESEFDFDESHDESEDAEVDPDELPMSWDEMRKAKRADRERKKLVSKHPVVETMWNELKAQPILAPAPAQQPPSITRKLKPFQLEGLSWMMEQEKSSYRGGLLGDEMGMGKTIQAVSLIMSDFPQPNPTLVIVPPVALMQWQKEIQVCNPLPLSNVYEWRLTLCPGIH